MTMLSWLMPAIFYLLIAAMITRAVAILVARRTKDRTPDEEAFAQLDLLPLNTPGEALSTYAAARSVLKSGPARPVGVLIIVCACAWVGMIASIILGLIFVVRG